MAAYYVCEFGVGFNRCGRRMSKDDFDQGLVCPGHVRFYLRGPVEDESLSTVGSALADAAAAMTVDIRTTSSQAISAPPATRQRLPSERQSVTRTFRLKYIHKDGTPDEMHLYVTAGVYADGRLGEVFLTTDRMGSFARGALDAAATMASLLLQYGVPLPVITGKLRHARFEPAGFTGDAEFPSCSSPLDLVAQWLDKRFGA